MTYQFTALSEKHHDALMHLFHSTETGSSDFRISREPDFFSLAKETGNTVYYGVTKNNSLIACLGITVQKLFIDGKPEDVYYIRDLRMDAKQGSPVVYGRLIKGICEVYRDVSGRAYSVVLGKNPNMHAVAEGKILFKKADRIGEIVHTGFPLFCGPYSDQRVDVISADDAWHFYSSTASGLDFAPADESCFKSTNGFFLGIKESGKLVAMCKIIDQEYSRKIIAIRERAIPEHLLNAYCLFKKIKGLPGKNEVFFHCYLSFYAASASKDYRNIFIAYLREHYASRYCYVFTGLLPGEAKKYKALFMIKFNSVVYGYGDVSGNSFRFPELTLI